MAVNPLDVRTPGESGELRDLLGRLGAVERELARVRATALTKQAIPAPYVPPPAPAWGYRTMRQAGAVSIPHNAWTNLTWPTEINTVGTAVDAPTAFDLRATVTGLYVYSAHLQFVSGGVASARDMQIMVGGTAVDHVADVTASAVSLHLARMIRLVAGTVVAVRVWQGSGAALNLAGPAAMSRFTLGLIHQEV